MGTLFKLQLRRDLKSCLSNTLCKYYPRSQFTAANNYSKTALFNFPHNVLSRIIFSKFRLKYIAMVSWKRKRNFCSCRVMWIMLFSVVRKEGKLFFLKRYVCFTIEIHVLVHGVHLLVNKDIVYFT